MKNPTIPHTAAIIAVAVVSGLITEAQQIVNGNFDLTIPSNGQGGGWTSANIDGSGGWRSSGGNPGGSFILNHEGDPGSDPTISQLVSGLTLGGTYYLTGDYASVYSESGNPSARSLAVDIDSGNVAMLGRPGGEGFYGSFSICFVATNAEAMIAFRGEVDGDDSSFQIDNISLTPASAPCPPSMFVQVASVQVCWTSDSNRLYQVQYRSDLTTNMWAPLGALISGNGTTNCIIDSVLGQPQRFYRIQCMTNATAR